MSFDLCPGGVYEELHAAFDGDSKLSARDEYSGKGGAKVGGKNGATNAAIGCAHGNGAQFGGIGGIFIECDNILFTEVWGNSIGKGARHD